MKKTRNFKKLMSSVLALVMVLSTMMLVPLTIGAEGLQGDGTEANPYLVGSKADLAAVAAAAAEATEAVYVKLTADIADLGAAALAQTVKWNIDGDNHTVTTTAPLIPVSDGGIVIKNLNVVTNQVSIDSALPLAGLVGTLKGVATFEKCTVSGSLYGSGIVGGLVAVMEAGKTTGIVTFTNCENNADVTAARLAGGFVAQVFSGEPTINGGINTGDVTSTFAGLKDADTSAAGFIGWQHDKNVLMVTIKNAINTGKIEAASGVVAAFAGHAKSSYVTLENCFDNGLVVRNLFGTHNRDTVVANNTATLAETMALITPPKTPASKLNLEAAAWDGIENTEPALQNPDAPNSAENPYLIGTAAELAFFSYHADRMIAVDYWAKLTADINLGGNVFLGMLTAYQENLDDDPELESVGINVTIDGDNYTIYNAIVNGYTKGFFKGYPDESAPSASVLGNLTLSNLHFAHITGEYSDSSTGGVVAGSIAGGSTTTLTNVTADATCMMVTKSDNSSVGGLVGNTQNCTFIADKCLSEVTLVSAGTSPALVLPTNSNGTRHGGIVGITNTDSTITITNSIGGSGMGQYVTAGYRVGAIVGVVLAESNFTFENVFAFGGLANVGCRYSVPAITNCYGPFAGMQDGNAEALAAICLAARGATEHIYANACDADCDICGLAREAADHIYTDDCDAICNVCEAERTAPHVYTNICDTECDVEGCGATRTVEHVWTNACDTTCDTANCGATRAIEHVYDNACDTACNICGATRTTAHVYTNDADIDCNVCGATRTVTAPVADDTTDTADTTAAADDDDAKKKGCKKSIDSTYAVIALISVLGFAFVAKKREEN